MPPKTHDTQKPTNRYFDVGNKQIYPAYEPSIIPAIYTFVVYSNL